MIQLEEIKNIIDKFKDNDRMELIKHYVNLAKEKLEDPVSIRKKKIALLRDCLQYIPVDDFDAFIDRVLDTKLLQTRALILDLIISNYSLEKHYISKPEKWIDAIFEDMFGTFDLHDDRDLLEIYNRKLCNEMKDIFCSCQRFNTAGNQLLLNMVAYKDKLSDYTKYDFDGLIRVFEERFNEGKKLPIEEIYRIYNEYKEEKKQKMNNRRKNRTK